MESGWDVKHLIRLIVMSGTYRQTFGGDAGRCWSAIRRTACWRAARASACRPSSSATAALKTSGLLVPRIGGPSVNPYTPGDLWREVSHYGSSPATAQTFVQDHGEKLYRRSLYTYWKRTLPPPNMAAFDAPNREVCTVARGNTNTPLQALVMLNDPQFVEAARAFAERMLHRAGDDAAKLRWAFLEAVSRQPNPAELARSARRPHSRTPALHSRSRSGREQSSASANRRAMTSSPGLRARRVDRRSPLSFSISAKA